MAARKQKEELETLRKQVTERDHNISTLDQQLSSKDTQAL